MPHKAAKSTSNHFGNQESPQHPLECPKTATGNQNIRPIPKRA